MKRLIGLVVVAFLVFGLTVASASGASTSPDNLIYQVNPLVKPTTTDTYKNPFCSSNGWLICYTPSDIQTAYNYPSNLTGAGQTIVIVDAYGSPTVQEDLAAFDAKFNLSGPPGGLQVVCPSGCPAFNPSNTKMNEVGWADETSLDVQWAHAMAPAAKLVLAVAPTPYGDAINSVEAKIFSDPAYAGAIVSQSFGEPENLITANSAQVLQGHRNYLLAKQNGLTVLASAGDWGATNFGATPNAAFPSSDPNVLAIGGTQGDPFYLGNPDPTVTNTTPSCAANTPCTVGLATVQCATATNPSTANVVQNGAVVRSNCPTVGYGGEQTWREDWIQAATGGAPSWLFAGRSTPDVSYNAAVDGGVLVHLGFAGANGFYIFGGTSAGSPQMSAVMALANQARDASGKAHLGLVNGRITALAQSASYSSDFHDITVGNNQLLGTPAGESAGTRYDMATGWGTPNVANLVADLAK